VVAAATVLGCCTWGPLLVGLGNKAGLPYEVAFAFMPFGIVMAALAGAFVTEVVVPWMVSVRRDGEHEESDDGCS
jgi:hypothetical protein